MQLEPTDEDLANRADYENICYILNRWAKMDNNAHNGEKRNKHERKGSIKSQAKFTY
jgi:hypothetical protein